MVNYLALQKTVLLLVIQNGCLAGFFGGKTSTFRLSKVPSCFFFCISKNSDHLFSKTFFNILFPQKSHSYQVIPFFSG